MSNQQWWYEEGGQPKGPLASQEIRSMVETGALRRSSRIIVVGGTEWATIDEHASELGLPAESASEPAAGGPSSDASPSAVGPARWSADSAGSSGSSDGAGQTAQTTAPAPFSYNAPPAATAGPAPSPTPTGLAPLASPGKRLGAFLLDGLIIAVSAITLFLGWLIWAFIVFGKGQTPGKQLLGLRVVDDESGKVVSYATMALRTLVYELLLGSVTSGVTTIIGGVMLVADKDQRQALWDKMASSVVVEDPEGRTL